MRIKTPELALVKFRADLPVWMGKGLFIEIDGRPSGRINQDFMAARERVDLAQRVWAAQIDAIADPGEKVKAKDEAATDFGQEWLGVIYDTCVIAWRTNLVDAETNKPLTCDRATFLDLASVRITEIARAFIDFQTAVLEAGAKVVADTEATIKN